MTNSQDFEHSPQYAGCARESWLSKALSCLLERKVWVCFEECQVKLKSSLWINFENERGEGFSLLLDRLNPLSKLGALRCGLQLATETGTLLHFGELFLVPALRCSPLKVHRYAVYTEQNTANTLLGEVYLAQNCSVPFSTGGTFKIPTLVKTELFMPLESLSAIQTPPYEVILAIQNQRMRGIFSGDKESFKIELTKMEDIMSTATDSRFSICLGSINIESEKLMLARPGSVIQCKVNHELQGTLQLGGVDWALVLVSFEGDKLILKMDRLLVIPEAEREGEEKDNLVERGNSFLTAPIN